MSYQGYGPASSGGEGHKKKKIVIMAVSSLILVAMVVAVAVGTTKSHEAASPATPAAGAGSNSDEIHSSMKAIKAICQPTDYKETCEESLSSAAGSNTTDPKELAKVAFKVAVDEVKKALAESRVLKEVEKEPRAAKALENCKDLMGYSIDDLEASLKKFSDFDISRLEELIADVKIWLSASRTYQGTCIDGFDNTTGTAGQAMSKALAGASKLTSNVLAIVDEISKVLADFKLPSSNRRLLSDDVPSWISDGSRRLLAAGPGGIKPNVVVAKDGSGDYKSISDAVSTIPMKSKFPYVIYVKKGIYNEAVIIEKHMWNVVLIGDGPTNTVITNNNNYVDGTPTFMTATLAVVGDGFIGKNFGVVNSAGPEKHQAVAIRVQSDKSVFYKCQFDGYQDTLYAHTKRQFYRDCTISGTIDFIFGNSATVLQNCKIVVRKPMDNQKNIITAHGRKDRREPTALIILNSEVVADPKYEPVKKTTPTYLGRPWKVYSRTFYLQSELPDFIHPDGWLPWEGDLGLKTCFYAEFDNRGPGADVSKRVTWPGIKTSKMNLAHVQKFTPAIFIQGNQWIKKAGVPYNPDLLPTSAH